MADLWTREEENCLILFYRKHPSLWKSDDKDYTNRIERKRLYFKLAVELASVGRKCTIKDITNKYRNLKSIYYRELKKVKEAYKSASESDDVRPYIPRWEHFHKLRFLPMYPNAGEFNVNTYVHPDVQCNIEIKEEAFEEYSEQDATHHQESSSVSETSENDNLQLHDDPFHQIDACSSSYIENPTSDQQQNGVEVSGALDFYRNERPRKRHSERRSPQDEMMPIFFKRSKDQTFPDRDDVDIFLELLGRKLRRLTPMRRESTEMEIHQVVHQALLNEMSSSNSGIYSALCSSSSISSNTRPT